ncbi:uncharacterized protein [Triticum aestivum]|uniref:uncharacterized protein isoform X5 n=1 Tax=Triticum aestivum TaxID=4565 RepID=UPI001D01385F|nr:uncharacterized protein LOC123191218 isoform X5 [Triticum aestivum]
MRSGCFLNVGMNASLHYTRLHCKAAGNSIGIYFGPEKATIINTYAVMKSGMKNLDESGNNGAISSQKAQKRLRMALSTMMLTIATMKAAMMRRTLVVTITIVASILMVSPEKDLTSHLHGN